MPRIPQSFIEELLGRADIVELIDKRVPLKKQGREFAACCPFHNEKSPSFFVSPVKQFYHCFGCGAHGTAISFLMEYEHMEFPEAVREVASMVGMEMPQLERGEDKTSVLAPLYEVLDKAARYYREQLKRAPQAIDYLKNRGLTGEIAAEFGMGFVPAGWDNLLKAVGTDNAAQQALLGAGMLIEKEGEHRFHDRFRERVMFPIRDSRGRIIGFGGRVMGKDEPKYLNSPETALFHKGRELYGLYEARQALRDIPRLLVVEGYMDVVALAQYGLRYAVATLGTSTTEEHLKKLFRVAPEVVFCFDGDRAGRAAAWRALENALPEAQDGRQIRFLFLPDGEDPDSLVRKEGKEAFEKRIAGAALPLSEYLLSTLAEQTDMKSMDGRARLADLAKPHVARLPAGVLREMLLDELARRTQVGREKLTMLKPAPGGHEAGTPKTPGRPQLNSPVRKAIGYLLHRPVLGALVGPPSALGGDLKGTKVLRELLEFTQTHPHITVAAAVLEHWRERDSETWAHLDMLAQAEIVTPEEALESEFRALMQDLTARRPAAQRRDELIAESRKRGLNSAEKAELTRLLAPTAGKSGADSAKSS
ncbi:MAG TPA: DNA primase [Gammaproteobacteria bacterium]|jgi:DNA primase|nr:DNA primase [Gammaproteobacteria bacterium]